MSVKKIKKGDEVVVLTGRDRGRRGTVVSLRSNGRLVVVEGVNVVKRHTRPNPQRGTSGGIIEKEMPLHVSNVALFNPVTGGGDRIGVKRLEDGRKVRVFKSTGEVVDL